MDFIKMLAAEIIKELAVQGAPKTTVAVARAARNRAVTVKLQCSRCHKRLDNKADLRTNECTCSGCGHTWVMRLGRQGERHLTGQGPRASLS